MREIVAYYRVSTKTQGVGGLGMQAQRDAVARYALANGFPIVQAYSEVESARREHLQNRPQLMRAVAHVRRSKALLVIARLDRLARNVLVTSQLLESGVEFVACDNPYANRLTIHILAAMAEHEGKLISERTKAGLAAARARGHVFRCTRQLTPEECRLGQLASARLTRERTRIAYADLVPIVGQYRNEGTSCVEIARRLNELGQRTQRGTLWSQTTVQAFVKREGIGGALSSVLNRNGPDAQRIRHLGHLGRERYRNNARAALDERALRIVRAALERGDSRVAICRELEQLGIKSVAGGRVSPNALVLLLRRHGLAPERKRKGWRLSDHVAASRRERALRHAGPYLALALRLREPGHSNREIADALNDYCYRPPRADRWNAQRVYLLLLRFEHWDQKEQIRLQAVGVEEAQKRSAVVSRGAMRAKARSRRGQGGMSPFSCRIPASYGESRLKALLVCPRVDALIDEPCFGEMVQRLEVLPGSRSDARSVYVD